ncbi:MAG: sugar phosphate nucleotidyltransferase [Candidatus Micrarchaeia archaeon]
MVLAAGEGKRLRPLTYTRPKCMIALAGKPILEHVLMTLKGAGIREAVIVVKYLEDVVRRYFGDGSKVGMKLHFVTQGEKYGTGAAFLCAREYVSEEPFVGMAGDVITEASFVRRLIKEHSGETITMGLKAVPEPGEYGVAELRGNRVSAFEEKPAAPTSNLANTSVYVFEPKVFAELASLRPSPRGEIEVTDVIKKLAGRGEVKGVVGEEYWLDMGMPWHLFDANEFLLAKLRARVGKIENCTVRGKLIMERGAVIHNSYVEGTVYVGEGTTVGPHAFLRGTTSIGRECDIGDSTTVKNSIIFDRVNAKHLTYIGDSIVGEGCNFGAGTQIANFRFDEAPVKAEVEGRVMDTMRRKLGAIIGDEVKTGVLSCIMPGKLVGDHCWIGPGVVVARNIPRHTAVFAEQKLIFKKREGGG